MVKLQEWNYSFMLFTKSEIWGQQTEMIGHLKKYTGFNDLSRLPSLKRQYVVESFVL